MITPRVGVAGIEFVRSREGSDQSEVVEVPLDVCKYLLQLGAWQIVKDDAAPGAAGVCYHPDAVLAILRREAEKL